MSQLHEAQRLVIQHLKSLEESQSIAEEIDAEVFRYIDNRVEKWVESRPDSWQGYYDAISGRTDFQPESWGANDNGYYAAYYRLAWTGSDQFGYTLSSLLGLVQQQFGLYFSIDVVQLTQLKTQQARSAWDAYLADHLSQHGLVELGFLPIDGGHLFRPIKVDANLLAQDYPASIADAVSPVLEDLFNTLEVAHPRIDALLKAARQEFNVRAGA